MNIAIIGGGASGMIAAYLLDRQGHAVTVYERQPILGGHIRTLNQNIHPLEQDNSNQYCSEFLEAGVLEFPVAFTHFLWLMQELEIPLEPVEVGSGIFFQDGGHYLSQGRIRQQLQGWQKWRELLRVNTLYARSIRLWLKTHFASPSRLSDQSLASYLASDSPQATWVKLLTMYSYSMPYTVMDDFPAELAIPALRQYVFCNWVRIQGGVYSYITKILSQFRGEVVLNTEIKAIQRSNNAVQIQGMIAGIRFDRQFDRVIFATPPDQVLQLLSDARPEEVRRFQSWQPNYATTILHRDDGHLYRPHSMQQGAEFDFFQTPTGWGYNAYLNQLCSVRSPQAYSLAFNLQSRIAPEHIISIQKHHTPYYTVDAFRYRQEIIANNGQHQTHHVGAYLGDGLHEGAATSAIRVAQSIGMASPSNSSPSKQLTPYPIVYSAT